VTPSTSRHQKTRIPGYWTKRLTNRTHLTKNREGYRQKNAFRHPPQT
jgi:hypothetical protein